MNDIIQEPVYYISADGEEHEIFPLLVKDIPTASRLFSKLRSDQYAMLNAPDNIYYTSGKNKGKPKIDRKTKEPILDWSAWNAQVKLLEMATHETEEEFGSWVNVKNIPEILDIFRDISEVKKKIMQQTALETSTVFSQLSSKTQAKQENPSETIPSDN